MVDVGCELCAAGLFVHTGVVWLSRMSKRKEDDPNHHEEITQSLPSDMVGPIALPFMG